MKSILIFGGLILIFICVVPLKHHLAQYDTQKNGQTVKSVITHVPNCIGTKIKHFIKFRFENKIYSKKTSGKPCDEFRKGDTLVLKHTPGTDIFLYENENIEREFIAFGILGLAGISFLIWGFRKR